MKHITLTLTLEKSLAAVLREEAAAAPGRTASTVIVDALRERYGLAAPAVAPPLAGEPTPEKK